ncbi:MAG: hypothetical protein IRY95_03615, partial [Clostridia bacterium]|nr:hypothetical protein [Clostridia bacterium]
MRGIYLTGWSAGSPERLEAALAYLGAHGLNTLVIDIKDDDGRLSFDLPGTRAAALGASAGKIRDPRALLDALHARGIYVIGRLVTFADPFASQRRPDWAILQDGRLWRDYRGIGWLSPWSREAWEYNIEVGVAAARLGFDEIQFDYVRLPESRLKGYNDTADADDRVAQVTAFLRTARERIRQEAGVPVSADVFGIVSVAEGDGLVGQRYPDIARAVDVISPMDYPSLYAKGELGIPDPYARPHDIVWMTVARASQRTPDLPRSVQRPWIQGYAYGPAGVEAQLEALAEAGLRSFLVWNARNVYPDGVDYGVIDRTPLKAPHAVWLDALHDLVPAKLPVLLPSQVPAPGSPAPPGSARPRARAKADWYAAELWTPTAEAA